MTYLELAKTVLENTKIPMTTNEIWEKAKSLGLDRELNSMGKTPFATLGAQMYVNVKDTENSSLIALTTRPKKFYLKTLPRLCESDLQIEPKTIIRNVKQTYNERDLHALLVKFVYANQHFKCYAKTIFHEKSDKEKKGSNEWLHPDIVGVYFPFNDYDRETLHLQETLSLTSIKLFSFELKLELNMSNLRKHYFQSVSNSSWSNEGYLVTLDLDSDSEFMDELRRLNSSFGIGVIKLNPEFIYESEIIMPSQIEHDLDWETIDRICIKNPDFKDFIKSVSKSSKIKEANKTYFDEILSDDEYEKYCKSKGLI
jgi:hypothetical protein